jgi:homoserine dehydrogenase
LTGLRLLLAGFGHVGRRLAELLDRGFPGVEATVVGVTTGSHGAWADPAGLPPGRILELYRTRGGFPQRLDTLEIVRSLDYDVLVELSPLAIAARGEPAIAHVRAALARGRHAVSANKGPVAWAYRELSGLARERGVRFLFESAVMDGAPVFNLRRHCLRGLGIQALDGVLNSTTNVVLGRMEQGAGLEQAVAEAQAMGIAEADPAADLDGWDAAVKLAALANVLMDAELAPEAVLRQGIRHLGPGDLAAAGRRGRRIKLVCEAARDGGGVSARVEPRELDPAHPFARLEGADSILRLHTDLMGRISILEESPGLDGTAYGVLGDLLTLVSPY